MMGRRYPRENKRGCFKALGFLQHLPFNISFNPYTHIRRLNHCNQTLDGGGKTFDVVGANSTWDSAINITGGTIKNLTINSGFRGVFVNHNSSDSGHVTLENVTIDGPVYTISCDQGTNNGLTAINSTFNGWTSYAKTIGAVEFVDCYFCEGSGYSFCRPYAPTEFVGCVFEEGFEFDTTAADEIIFDTCYYGDTLITAENATDLALGETVFFYKGIGNVTIK